MNNQLDTLALVASKTTDVIVITDAQGYITYVNDAYEKLTGYTMQEVLGRRPGELVQGPETDAQAVNRLRQAVKEHKTIHVEILNYSKSKRKYWQSITIDPVFNDAGECVAFVSINKDITERKQQEKEFRNLHEILTRTNQVARIGGWNLDLVENKLTWTEVTREIHEVDPDYEITLESALPFYPKGNRSLIEKAMNEAIQSGKSYDLELQLTTAKGNQLWVRAVGTPEFKNGVCTRLYGTFQDINEQKLSRIALEESESRLSTLITNLNVGILLEDEQRRIVLTNNLFCSMFLIPAHPDQLIGMDCSQSAEQSKHLFKDPDEFVKRVDQILMDKNPVSAEELVLADGQHYERDYIPIFINNIYKGHLWKYQDITTRKNQEQELEMARNKAEESSRAKETFLANMSHEMRTPLNAIMGMIREIGREPLSPDQNKYLKSAALASQHLLSVVNDILDITKIESGQMDLNLHPFNLNMIIDNVLSILSTDAQEKMLKINTAVTNLLAPAYLGDEGRIRQVLLNTVNNAIKFTEKGSILVECLVTDATDNRHQVKITVTDTGIGMDELFINHIFDKFSQGDFSASRRYGGVGLGMAITYQLVQMMNGTINVKSRKGFGTAVEIMLDLEITNEKQAFEPLNGNNYSQLKGKKVLLVEDNDLNRMVAVNSLQYYGMDVTEVTDGEEAIQKVKESSFDLILMDLQMPVMGGLEATQVIRQELKSETPIVALTANAFQAEIDRSKEAGMNDYITKPFTEELLIGTILSNLAGSTTGAANTVIEEKAPLAIKQYSIDNIVQLSRGNKDFIQKMINLFVEQTPVAVENIKQAYASDDLDAVKKIAHRIKPTLDNFSIEELKQDIRTIESMAEKGMKNTELATYINRLDEILKRVVREMAEEKI